MSRERPLLGQPSPPAADIIKYRKEFIQRLSFVLIAAGFMAFIIYAVVLTWNFIGELELRSNDWRIGWVAGLIIFSWAFNIAFTVGVLGLDWLRVIHLVLSTLLSAITFTLLFIKNLYPNFPRFLIVLTIVYNFSIAGISLITFKIK